MKFNKPHFCPDWDFMLIVPHSIEMDACICGENGSIVQPGDMVKTEFYRHEKDKVRVIRSCFISPTKSQSGWFICTEDGLTCDAGWFHEV